jgi:hypothetical protein
VIKATAGYMYLVKLGNLHDQPLEGHLPDEQLSALLVLANLTGTLERKKDHLKIT